MFENRYLNGQPTVQNFYIWNRYNRMSGPTQMFILWLQLSASCHYLIDSTPDTMIQHFCWRYTSISIVDVHPFLSLAGMPKSWAFSMIRSLCVDLRPSFPALVSIVSCQVDTVSWSTGHCHCSSLPRGPDLTSAAGGNIRKKRGNFENFTK